MKKILCFALLCWISPENPHAEDHSEQELKRIQNRHLVVKITESYPTQHFALLILVFLATGICTAKVPDLLGKWNGSWSAYDEGIGYSNLTENGSFFLTFTKQHDRIFAGNLTFKPENGTETDEGLAGAIGLDN